MHPTVRHLSAVSCILGMAAACTGGPAAPDPSGSGTGDPSDRPVVLPDDTELAAALTGFEECDELERHVKDAALELVTPWGLHGGGGVPVMGRDAAVDEEATDDAGGAQDTDAVATDGADAPAEGDSGAVGSNETGTNVQEAGVDEPDHVKTDGELLYVADGQRLRILDVTASDPVEVGSLGLRDAHDAQLLLDGDRLLVTSSAPQAVPFADEPASAAAEDRAMPVGGGGGTTTLTTVDVSEPTEPTVTERLTVDGHVLSSRLIDGVARIAVRMEQGNLPWEQPEASGLRAERRALEANRALIEDSELDDWLPYAVHETADGAVDEGMLLDCRQVARPATFSGLGVLSVLTVDLADEGLGLDPSAHVGVLAGGDTVYASQEALYVSTTRWVDWEAIDDEARREELASERTSEIHRFDLGDPSVARYTASGEVPGTLLDQWAMSEHDGVLRVASTSGDPWGGGDRPSESFVTTLAERDGELERLGQVDGLGLTERIYAVRFIGDTGYVVTFRQTDPLYTIDLSDPADPTMTGELKILGYSAYLHPIGDDLLLGVGQDADEQGRTRGAQLSVFDVADPKAPREVDKVVLSDASSDAEHDHRAFMHDPGTGLTVIPYTRWDVDHEVGREDVDTGALGFAVVDGRIEERGRVRHEPAWLDDLRDELDGAAADELDEEDWRRQERIWEWGHRGRISRTLVLDGRVVTVSELGVGLHDIRDLSDTGWLGFEDRS